MEYSRLDTHGAAQEIMLHNFFQFVAISFMYYDHLLTSRREIEILWRRPKCHSSYYFFVNRYFAFFGNLVVSVVGSTDLTSESCKRYNLCRQLLVIVTQVLVSYLLTLRIYALYERSRKILTHLVAIGAVLGLISIWALFGQKSAPAAMSKGCHIGISQITAIRLASAWEALFVYDSIIFGLTLFKAWSAWREYSISGPVPLLTLILRDGVIYYAVMALANLSNILSFYLCGPFSRGYLSTFASDISVTMMSRLMLNLHEAADIGIFSTQRTTRHVGVEYTEEGQASAVELDTVWTETASRCERQTQGGQTTMGGGVVSGLTTIDEEQGSSESNTRFVLY